MSEASDELTLRLNVKFREGTAPVLQAELLKLPGKHRVKRLLELGNLGLMAERRMALVEADYREQELASGQTTERAVTPKPLAAADVNPIANPVAPPAQDQLAKVGAASERELALQGARESIEAAAHDDGTGPGRLRRRPGFNINLSG